MCFAPDLINLDQLSPSQKARLKRKLEQCKDLLNTRLKDVDEVLKKLERKRKAKGRR